MNIMKYTIKEEWIRNGITEDAIDQISSFGKSLSENSEGKKPLTTSQLRKFFGELRRIDADFDKKYQDVLMLRPMLAYAVGRDGGKTKLKDFSDVLSEGIKYIRLNDEVHRKADFKNFLKIFEAIVAYHKYSEIKNKSI